MGFVKNFLDFFFDEETKQPINAVVVKDELSSNLWAYKYALDVAAEKISSLITLCDFRYFYNDEEKKGKQYLTWLWFNKSPNKYQSKSVFLRKLIYKLITNEKHHALIINVGNELYVAEEFTIDMDNNFTNVTYKQLGENKINIPYKFNRYNSCYFIYENAELDSIFKSMKNFYYELIINTQKAGTYRQKYTLNIDQQAQNSPMFEEVLQDLLDKQFSSFMKGENVVLPLYDGMKVDQLSAGADLGQNASVANNSIRNLNEDIISKVGNVFNIPKSIILGVYEDKDLDDMLQYCLKSFCQLLEDTINHSECFIGGLNNDEYRIYIDLKTIRHLDMVSVSEFSNKAISSGVYTINDIKKATNDQLVKEKIGDTRFITRNYAVLGEYVTDITNNINYKKGQEKNEV